MGPGRVDPPRVELFVRSLDESYATVESAVSRLRDLEESGEIADLSIHVWGREISLSSTAMVADEGEMILERVAAFRAWAEAADVSLEPFFDDREVHSEITGEEYASLLLPACCLAEYRDDDLVHVAPFVADDAVCSVPDRISALERRTARQTDAPPIDDLATN